MFFLNWTCKILGQRYNNMTVSLWLEMGVNLAFKFDGKITSESKSRRSFKIWTLNFKLEV